MEFCSKNLHVQEAKLSCPNLITIFAQEIFFCLERTILSIVEMHGALHYGNFSLSWIDLSQKACEPLGDITLHITLLLASKRKEFTKSKELQEYNRLNRTGKGQTMSVGRCLNRTLHEGASLPK